MSSNCNYLHMRPATSKNVLVIQQFLQRYVHEIATWKSLYSFLRLREAKTL